MATEFTYKGKTYVFDVERDFRVGHLRKIKEVFPSLGSLLELKIRLAVFDPEAVLSLMWAALRNSGEEIDSPNDVEDSTFAELDIKEHKPKAPKKEKQNPTKGGAEGTPSSSAETPTNSEADT